MRTNTVWENNNLSVSLAVSKNLSIFTSTRPCGVLHTSVRSTPHERVEVSTRTCGDRRIITSGNVKQNKVFKLWK